MLLRCEGVDNNHLTPACQIIPRSQTLHCHFTHIKLTHIFSLPVFPVQQNVISLNTEIVTFREKIKKRESSAVETVWSAYLWTLGFSPHV